MTSLTLKPHLLRADTIDLQSAQSPSAKDHSRGQYQSGYSYGGPGPNGSHHTQALRNANQEAYQEQHTSPHLGGFDHHDTSHLYDDDDEEDDHGPNGMNGNSHGDGYDDADGNDSQDDDMDDDLLDKISSSPSIEDGKPCWPKRADSLCHGRPRSAQSTPTRGASIPSPTHRDSPSVRPTNGIIFAHRQSPHNSPRKKIDFKHVPKLSPARQRLLNNASPEKIVESNSIDNIQRHLLPSDDPFLDIGPEQALEDAPTSFETAWYNEILHVDDSESSDDDRDVSPFRAEPRFLDSGWGGECLRDPEDIDFEFVYALHTFVATVEGQANATKGDTMVLLDDSNSYWWLVRVVKDGSIGYLPAEHIETPTERLARLNKHRNIDLAAAMLGDNPEKSKNPLKKAMRRRNAKTVNFAPPTYYEPDEQVWSDEEEEQEDEDGQIAHVENTAAESVQQTQQQAQQAQTQQKRQLDQGDHAQVASQTTQVSEQQKIQPASATVHRVDSDNETEDDEPSSPNRTGAKSTSQTQTGPIDSVQRSRKGVVRNTDSFFRDDSVETKKISLTPQLLRGESANVVVTTDQEPKQRPSLDTFDKVVGEDKPKDNKKKEKKGMLSGLFKRKDKGNKTGKQESDETDRLSEDSNRSPQSKESLDSDFGSERKPGKLQKANPTGQSPKSSPVEMRSPVRDFAGTVANTQQPGPGPGQKIAEPPTQVSQIAPLVTPEQRPDTSKPAPSDKRSVFAPIAGALRSKNSSQDMGETLVKAVYSKRAKERSAIDNSDSEDENAASTRSSALHRSISPLGKHELGQGRPDSTIRVSPMGNYATDTIQPLTMNSQVTSKVETEPAAPVTTIPTSPSDQTASTSKRSPSIPTHTPSTSRSTPTWSDASLRSYMENDQDIRDLLVIVHDKTNITPVSADHPLMNGLFAPERTKLADMQTQLDTMLMSWLSRKNHPLTKV